MQWSYGIITIHNRLETLLPRTINSLRRAGFSQPRLFIDDCNDPSIYSHFGLETVCHYPRIKIMGNWWLALIELYYRNPEADRYVIFQDDIITYHNLRIYLEHAQMPEDGYLNLYTMPRNQQRCPYKHTGWFMSDQLGKGALALVFTRLMVISLITNSVWASRPQSPDRGYNSIDGGIADALTIRNGGQFKEYCHNPSLVEHIGDKLSSIREEPCPDWMAKAAIFFGEDFNALELLKNFKMLPGIGPKAPLPDIPEITIPNNPNSVWDFGDHVKSALDLMGITQDRVKRYLGTSCYSCVERQRRLNRVGQWCRQALLGEAPQVKRMFEEVLGGK